MKHLSVILLFIYFLFGGNTCIMGQTVDSTQYKKVYTNYTEALKEPAKVYRLNLSNMPLDSFPIDLSKFKNLQYLCVSNNQIEFIPREIEHLQNLRGLQLVGENLKTLPPEFSELKNLEEIYLNVNKKTDFTQNVNVLSTMPKLTILHVENGELVELPGNFSILVHLEKLYLNDNKLTDVPEQVNGLKNLKYLDMQRNKIPPIKMSNYQNFGLRVKF
jgi:Leucine-rich repeat (LRR) protein